MLKKQKNILKNYSLKYYNKFKFNVKLLFIRFFNSVKSTDVQITNNIKEERKMNQNSLLDDLINDRVTENVKQAVRKQFEMFEAIEKHRYNKDFQSNLSSKSKTITNKPKIYKDGKLIELEYDNPELEIEFNFDKKFDNWVDKFKAFGEDVLFVYDQKIEQKNYYEVLLGKTVNSEYIYNINIMDNILIAEKKMQHRISYIMLCENDIIRFRIIRKDGYFIHKELKDKISSLYKVYFTDNILYQQNHEYFNLTLKDIKYTNNEIDIDYTFERKNIVKLKDLII